MHNPGSKTPEHRCQGCGSDCDSGSSTGTGSTERSRHMQVSEIMHEYPVCCTEVDTAQHAAELMKEQHAGALPVVEKHGGGTLVGVVTDRDLCLRVIAEGRNPRMVL